MLISSDSLSHSKKGAVQASECLLIQLSNVLEPEATLMLPLSYPPSGDEELRVESSHRHCRRAPSEVPAPGLDTATLWPSLFLCLPLLPAAAASAST